MSSIRAIVAPLVVRSACRQCRQLTSQRAFSRTAIAAPQPRPQPLIRPTFSQTRYYSTPEPETKLYGYDEMKSLSEEPSESRVLIDVREPHEYADGYIPSAINVPIKSQPDAMFLPADEFEERFGFAKPPHDAEVVFYCRAGVRATSAAQLAQQIGYSRVSEYRGSWLDWEKNGGRVVKP